MKRKSTKVGFVYVLSHPAWRGLRQFHRPNGHIGAVKIGYTKGAPGARGLRIQAAAGLIAKPVVECYWWVDDCRAVEKASHLALAQYRISATRELFCVPVETAKAVIENLLQPAPPEKPKKRLIDWLIPWH